MSNILEMRISRRDFMKASGALAIDLIAPEIAYDLKVLTFHWADQRIIRSKIIEMEGEGRTNILPRDFAAAMLAGIKVPPGYILTADDGYEHQMQYLKVLDDLGKKMAFYVMGDWRGNGVFSYLTYPQVREISDLGHEIGCHTRDHPSDLPIMRVRDHGDFQQQVVAAKKFLEDTIGEGVWTFAYPNGNFDMATANELAQYYRLAFTTQPGNILKLSQAMTLPRIGIN